jgi:hypothetical protein
MWHISLQNNQNAKDNKKFIVLHQFGVVVVDVALGAE